MFNVNRIYSCSKVMNGSELYYLCELGRYLKKYNETLSLDGVVIEEFLTKSKYWDYFCYSIENGYLSNVHLDFENARVGNVESVDLSKFFTTDLTNEKTSPKFESQTDFEWHWSIKGSGAVEDEIANNLVLNGTYRSQAWVSLLAMVAVHKVKNEGLPKNLRLTFDDVTITHQKMAVSDILLLSQRTKALENWVTLEISNERQCIYEAWVFENKDLGHMTKQVSVAEKKEVFKSHDFQVGDAVFIYSKGKNQKDDKVREVQSCKIAVIDEITDRAISFKYLSNPYTERELQKIWEGYSESVKQMYSYGHKPSRHIGHVEYMWMDLGIEHATYDEEVFITGVENSDDTASILASRIKDGVEQEHRLTVSATDGVYWLLKDSKVPFNEEHMKELYFKNSTPAYDLYMQGGLVE